MKKFMIGLFIFALLVVLSACPSANGSDNGNDNGNGTSSTVATPTIATTPDQVYNNDPISVILTTTTEGASIYYTINGPSPTAENGELYSGAFNLEFSDVHTPHRGYVKLQVIGVKEGSTNSAVAERELQIFPSEAIGNKTGSDTQTREGWKGPLDVTITMAAGYITAVDIVSGGYEGTEDSADYWTIAETHGEAFLLKMNHWDFDVRTGATETSGAIKSAAEAAIANISDGG